MATTRTPGSPSDSFILRFEQMARRSPKRIVDLELRALAHAERRLADFRRIYHGTRSGYRKARDAFRAIQDDVRHDRYIAACLKFSPLLYNSFYLPHGSLSEGAGHWYLHSVRRIQTALCG